MTIDKKIRFARTGDPVSEPSEQTGDPIHGSGRGRKKRIEILAPAGGFDSVIAAAHSGADAVYIGAKSFSARASAHNFDDDELRECVRYCHRRGIKVHLALNTLIFDDEMPAAVELVKTAARADIDALIIQDLGLVSLIKKTAPDLPLHASTQLSVHTPYGARALYEMGFERVVLSRELSLAEIKEIRDFCPEVELEVFVCVFRVNAIFRLCSEDDPRTGECALSRAGCPCISKAAITRSALRTTARSII